MAGDADYSSVALLLNGDGTNGSTSIQDQSYTPKTISVFGNAQISTTQSKWGGSSLSFDGSGDYLTAGAIADFKFLHDDTTDFSIEGWLYWSGGTSDLTVLSTAASTANIGFLLSVLGTNSRRLLVQIYRGASGSFLSATSSAGISSGAWTYFKFSYTAGTRAYSFRIGSADAGSGTMSVTGTWPASSTANPSFVLAVGRYQFSTPGGYFNGYIDSLRISTMLRTETTEPSAAFPHYAGQVSGVIEDDTGTPCARTVRLYLRSTGALISETTSSGVDGSYSFNTPTLGEVQRVVLDDDSGDLYNDLIDRVIPA